MSDLRNANHYTQMLTYVTNKKFQNKNITKCRLSHYKQVCWMSTSAKHKIKKEKGHWISISATPPRDVKWVRPVGPVRQPTKKGRPG